MLTVPLSSYASGMQKPELLEQRLALLHRRAWIGIPLTMLVTALLVYALYLRTGDLRTLYGLAAATLIQSLRLYAVHRAERIRDASGKPLPARAQLLRFWIGLAALMLAWGFSVVLVAPTLDEVSLLTGTSIFAIAQTINALTLSAFRRMAYTFMIGLSLPVAVALLLFMDDGPHPLGFVVFGWTVVMAMIIESVHISDTKALGYQASQSPLPAIVLPLGWLSSEQIRLLYRRAVMGIFLVGTLSFLAVAEPLMRAPRKELWLWFIAMLAVLGLRSLDVIAYQRRSAGGGLPTWVWTLRFSTGLCATVLVWYVFLWRFLPTLDQPRRLFVLGMLVAQSLGSVLTLGAVRWIALAYLLALLGPVTLIWLHEVDELNLWFAIQTLLQMVTVALLVEHVHRVTMASLHVEGLKNLAEVREEEAKALNNDLTIARSRLVDANATLEQKVVERTVELERLAGEDALTGLYNRHRFAALVKDAIDVATQRGDGFAIYFVDLDRFKEINDGLGHVAGDLVLKTIARRLRERVGQFMTCGRWGGDEFLLLQQGSASREEVERIGAMLLDVLGQPIDTYRACVTVGASIGVAQYPAHGSSAADLVEHADIAVYKAKQAGRGCLRAYQTEWGAEARHRLDLVQSLRHAIDTDALLLHFQPVVTIPDCRLHGFEALLRWPHPDLGIISPATFIPLAEESGLMPQLGSLALRRACSVIQGLIPDDKGPAIAVNVSVAQILAGDFVEEVRDVIRATGLAPHRLELEVTESLFATNLKHVRSVLEQLRALGVRISIDDFGTGYSSMNYLRSLPLDTLKIDRVFVKDLDSGGEAIFSTLVNLADSLQLAIVVEGVETEPELQRVLELGKHQLRVQGYYFGKPMPVSELQAWMQAPLPHFGLAPSLG